MTFEDYNYDAYNKFVLINPNESDADVYGDESDNDSHHHHYGHRHHGGAHGHHGTKHGRHPLCSTMMGQRDFQDYDH